MPNHSYVKLETAVLAFPYCGFLQMKAAFTGFLSTHRQCWFNIRNADKILKLQQEKVPCLKTPFPGHTCDVSVADLKYMESKVPTDVQPHCGGVKVKSGYEYVRY